MKISDETYKYIIKARRHKVKDIVFFRNLVDSYIYEYQISEISKKETILILKDKTNKTVQSNKKLHIIWCVVDGKTIEKQLPYLNEIGVDTISFVYCDYSQKNFKLHFDKYEKILINSSGQCGRSSIIKLEIIDSLSDFLSQNKDTFMLNFSSNIISTDTNIEKILVGCEGGFSESEVSNMHKDNIVGLNTNMILKSQTAISAVSAKILL